MVLDSVCDVIISWVVSYLYHTHTDPALVIFWFSSTWSTLCYLNSQLSSEIAVALQPIFSIFGASTYTVVLNECASWKIILDGKSSSQLRSPWVKVKGNVKNLLQYKTQAMAQLSCFHCSRMGVSKKCSALQQKQELPFLSIGVSRVNAWYVLCRIARGLLRDSITMSDPG